MKIARIALPLFLLIFFFSGGCGGDGDVIGMDITGEETVTAGTGVRLGISLNFDTENGMPPDDLSNEELAKLEYPGRFDWTVEPSDGASISGPGAPGEPGAVVVFSAQKPGTYVITAVSKDDGLSGTHSIEVFDKNRPQGTRLKDVQGWFDADLEPATCSGGAKGETTSTQAAELRFSVNGETVAVEMDSSAGTKEYDGHVNPDGKFTISSEQATFTLEVTGEFDSLGVEGVWKITKKDGVVCAPAFHGDRH